MQSLVIYCLLLFVLFSLIGVITFAYKYSKAHDKEIEEKQKQTEIQNSIDCLMSKKADECDEAKIIDTWNQYSFKYRPMK